MNRGGLDHVKWPPRPWPSIFYPMTILIDLLISLMVCPIRVWKGQYTTPPKKLNCIVKQMRFNMCKWINLPIHMTSLIACSSDRACQTTPNAFCSKFIFPHVTLTMISNWYRIILLSESCLWKCEGNYAEMMLFVSKLYQNFPTSHYLVVKKNILLSNTSPILHRKK